MNREEYIDRWRIHPSQGKRAQKLTMALLQKAGYETRLSEGDRPRVLFRPVEKKRLALKAALHQPPAGKKEQRAVEKQRPAPIEIGTPLTEDETREMQRLADAMSGATVADKTKHIEALKAFCARVVAAKEDNAPAST